MSRDYVVNSYDLTRVVAGPCLVIDARGEWKLQVGDKVIGKDRFEGRLPDKSDARVRGWHDFDEAAAAAEKRGICGPWMRPKHQYMDDAWWPTSARIPEGLQRRTRTDGRAPVVWVTGVPCRARSYGSWGDPCHNIAKTADGLCGQHDGRRRRALDEAAERLARKEADDAAHERHHQSKRAAEEALARLAPILASLGYHPDTVTVHASAGKRVGLLVAPEALESLVEELARNLFPMA